MMAELLMQICLKFLAWLLEYLILSSGEFYKTLLSTLVQVMAWHCQVTSHYLDQWWPQSVMSHGITIIIMHTSSHQMHSGNPHCLCNTLDHKPLLWRHNGHSSVSNHQPHDCLHNRLFRRRSNQTSKLPVTGLCVGNSPGPVNSPHKGPVTRKMFPFDDVIMIQLISMRQQHAAPGIMKSLNCFHIKKIWLWHVTCPKYTAPVGINWLSYISTKVLFEYNFWPIVCCSVFCNIRFFQQQIDKKFINQIIINSDIGLVTFSTAITFITNFIWWEYE